MKLLTKLLFVIFIASIATSSFAAKKASCDPNDDTVQLIKDMVRNKDFATAIKNNQELAEAWDLIYEASNKNKDSKKRYAVELLKGINKHFKQDPFKNSPDLRKDYINAIIKYKGKISTNSGNQGSNRFPDKAEVFFDTLFDYAKKFDGKAGFTLKESGGALYTQDGFYFSMRYMNSNKVSSSEIKSLDMKFESSEGGCPNCRFDATLNDGTLIEFKSYKDPSKIPLKQFKAYIGSINSIDQLRYVFNKDKATISEAKDGMAKVIDNNKFEIWSVMSDELKAELKVTNNPSQLTPEVIQQMVNEFVEVY